MIKRFCLVSLLALGMLYNAFIHPRRLGEKSLNYCSVIIGINLSLRPPGHLVKLPNSPAAHYDLALAGLPIMIIGRPTTVVAKRLSVVGGTLWWGLSTRRSSDLPAPLSVCLLFGNHRSSGQTDRIQWVSSYFDSSSTGEHPPVETKQILEF